MRIRLLQTVTGSFHGVDGGVERGSVVDVPDVHAQRYIKSGLAEAADGGVEHAVVSGVVESAVVTPRKRARPRKAAEWHDDESGRGGWSGVEPE